MSLLNKIKVKLKSAQNVKIEVREKDVFICSSCRNHYNEYFAFCPQCLNEVRPNQPKSFSLKIISAQGGPDELAALLQRLSGKPDYNFLKALRALPWMMIRDTDPSILQQWKEVLEAHRTSIESQPTTKKQARGAVPLFAASAPPPYFLDPSVTDGVRKVASHVADAAMRLRWSETVLIAHQMMQQFYKGNPSDRVVFSDFLFEVEHQVREAVREYNAEFRSPTYLFTTAIDHLKESLLQMQAEMNEVKKQVEDQL